MTTIQSVNVLDTINNAVDKTASVVKHVDNKLTNTIAIIVTFLITQSKKILKFLIDRNVVSAGIAIIVGTQIGRITTAFVEYLLSPFINLILAGETKKLEDYEIEIYGVHFRIGLFISSLIQFIINMSMVYYVFQVAQFSSENFDSFLNQSVRVGTTSSR